MQCPEGGAEMREETKCCPPCGTCIKFTEGVAEDE